jgi:hypothetical protein
MDGGDGVRECVLFHVEAGRGLERVGIASTSP